MSRISAILAEDNKADVFLVRTALEEARLAIDLRVYADGEEALLFLDRLDAGSEDFQPELVLLGLNLPRYSGAEVFQRLRLSPQCRDTKVIVVTSSDSPEDRALAAGLGAAYYFRKPTSFDAFMQLGRVVQEVLDGSEVTPVVGD